MTVKILTGDCLEVLRTLPDESVHCCVTSPPYWGLRDYGTAQWEGGDPACDHDPRRQDSDSKSATNRGTSRDNLAGSGNCRKCGAHRIDSQLGLEPTPDEYVANMITVFREVRRVLRSDGVCFLNIGDSYARNGGTQGGENRELMHMEGKQQRMTAIPSGTALKEKDLCLIPERVVIALQQDGWWVRSKIIWAKKSPMPESCTDRPTNSWEPIFLLTKSANYFYDAEAVKEPTSSLNESHLSYRPNSLRIAREGRKEFQGKHEVSARMYSESGRNQRNVWHLGPEPFSEAHFAVFPTEIPRRSILAGTSEKGCCPKCGAPWERTTERQDKGYDGSKYGERAVDATGGAISGGTAKSTLGSSNGKLIGQTRTTGWEPGCKCDAGALVPCTVLDPFGGAGTTGLVADQLGRDAILIELNPEYVEMAKRRIEDDAGMFAMVKA
jgi:DNA modification methylase